ncbi:hypothetical protein (plasmid) [Lactobacillus plantarum subsp. plantarum] [Lactiplantibacillus mudanjiangensis]|uniref:hypothetical protein n=1 Tax=Lactiplantibacillus mudanjiangensis TaxID=1296538 RepID=UPI001014EF1E|nr:hypothetical protein [Lactiplantibacillus mudanjiangensis]VDG31484.1 hypothetical protein (plasmid) [Lactobacillus plantarum subsp. plantarum] [Lactiplantibacillus mudanjiangensis]
MKLSELKKRDDFGELAERAHHLVDDWDDFQIMHTAFQQMLDDNADKPMAVARQIDKWYMKNRAE